MYESFYGLRDRPFDIAPDPRFLFMTAGHREALCHLQYALSSAKPIALLTGEAGTGKTTLIHAAVESFTDRRRLLLHIANPLLSRTELLETIAEGFGIGGSAASSKSRLLFRLRRKLLELRRERAVTGLILDEAQSVPRELWEELRLLANLQTPTESLLPLVLVGQPELTRTLNDGDLRSLKQRIALRCALAPLSPAETASYIETRVRTAGGDPAAIFDAAAVQAIHHAARGIARSVSVLCDNVLVSGLALQQRPVTHPLVLEVARELDMNPPAEPACGGAPTASGPPRTSQHPPRGVSVNAPAPPRILAIAPAAVPPPTAAHPPQRGLFETFSQPRGFFLRRGRKS